MSWPSRVTSAAFARRLFLHELHQGSTSRLTWVYLQGHTPHRHTPHGHVTHHLAQAYLTWEYLTWDILDRKLISRTHPAGAHLELDTSHMEVATWDGWMMTG